MPDYIAEEQETGLRDALVAEGESESDACKRFLASCQESGIDAFTRLRQLTNERLTGYGSWTGVPFPLPGQKLRLEDRHPYKGMEKFDWDKPDGGIGIKTSQPACVSGPVEADADGLPVGLEIAVNADEDDDAGDIESDINAIILGDPLAWKQLSSHVGDHDTIIFRNMFENRHTGDRISVLERGSDHKSFHVRVRASHRRWNLALKTAACSEAWDTDAELTAITKLKRHVSKRQFHMYVTTGGFMESSDRSGVIYWFRKMHPTVAFREEGEGDSKTPRILAALCLHPQGYYAHTFAGVMVPTDDVIAHLLLMRGCEPKFWGWAGHHAHWEVESGL